MYLLTNYMGIFSVAKKINKHIAIHNASENNDGESFLTETYSFDFPWNWKLTYIPRYIKFFNSFECERFPAAGRSRWIFLNEAELYKLQRYRYYILDHLHTYYHAISDHVDMLHSSFRISEPDFLWLSS